jgi:hypothetical protein
VRRTKAIADLRDWLLRRLDRMTWQSPPDVYAQLAHGTWKDPHMPDPIRLDEILAIARPLYAMVHGHDPEFAKHLDLHIVHHFNRDDQPATVQVGVDREWRGHPSDSLRAGADDAGQRRSYTSGYGPSIEAAAADWLQRLIRAAGRELAEAERLQKFVIEHALGR